MVLPLKTSFILLVAFLSGATPNRWSKVLNGIQHFPINIFHAFGNGFGIIHRKFSGYDTNDTLINNFNFNATTSSLGHEDLLETVAVLRQQITILKKTVNNNKDTIYLLRKDKEILKRNYQAEIDNLKNELRNQLNELNEGVAAKIESEKLKLLNELKEKFEEEKAKLISSLKSEHYKEVSIIKKELSTVQASFNSSQLTVAELKVKLSKLNEKILSNEVAKNAVNNRVVSSSTSAKKLNNATPKPSVNTINNSGRSSSKKK
eukprot:gene10937-14686_t